MAKPEASSFELLILKPEESLWTELAKLFCAFIKLFCANNDAKLVLITAGMIYSPKKYPITSITTR
jgi:hypothetical protein